MTGADYRLSTLVSESLGRPETRKRRVVLTQKL